MDRIIPHERTTARRRVRARALAEAAYPRPRPAIPPLAAHATIVSSVVGNDAALTLLQRAPDLADGDTALSVLRTRAPHRFFAGANGHTASLLRMRTADGRVPRAATTTLAAPGNERDESRHQWLIDLAQEYVATGDGSHADACLAALDRWISRHPAGVEPDFARSAEAGFRLMSWCWGLLLLRDAPQLSGPWLTRVLATIWQHAAHLNESLSHYCPPPTHLTGNALGLFYAACLFPEFRDAGHWRETAARVLVNELQTQVGADGVQFEQSTCFHAYTADIYLHFALLAERNHLEVPVSVVARIERMFDFLLAIRRPDGSIPAIGDSDGGCLLPLARRAADDSRGRFAIAAVCCSRPDFAWAADSEIAELAWLMGAEGLARFDALRPLPPASAPSRVFPQGGYAVMRTGWERDAHQMIVDVGPLGCPASSGHGHADLLSIQCAIFGERSIVDPGTHCYGGDSKWRDFFRSTAAHSSVVVDGANQVEPAGPFGWRRHPRVRLREWHSTREFDFLDADHDGYTTLSDPVLHRRRVIFVKPGYWILVDDLSGAGRHQLDLTFQFASPDIRLGPHPWARAATPAGPVLWISPFPSAPAQPGLKCGEPSPTRGWISPELGRLSPAPMLIYSFAVALPWRIVTLLLPDRQGLSAPPPVRPIYDDGGLPHGFVFERPRRMVRFDDRAVLVERD
jgi:hypothetical protein